jgi:hypothetical protein
LGQSRNLKVRRVRHHRIAPLTANRIAASPATPMIVSPTSPLNRWWWRSKIHNSGRSHWLCQRVTMLPA